MKTVFLSVLLLFAAIARPNQAAPTDLLARAPLQQWDQRYTVRVSLDLGTHQVLGRFLLDPDTSVSKASPTWLSSQGIPPVFLWNLTPSGAKSSMRQVLQVFDTQVGGVSFPLRQFQLKTTDFFGIPAFAKACCDGVLGKDFFQHVRAEILTTDPPALQLYSKLSTRPLASPTPHRRGSSPSTPVQLTFTLDAYGDRVLRLTQIRAGTELARRLKELKIPLGSVVTHINSKDVSIIDEWLVRKWLQSPPVHLTFANRKEVSF